MKHQELIEQAAAWLRKKGCAVVITDMTHGGPETPDAIGWSGRVSMLIECKASRSDFMADRSKSFRIRPESGMGMLRYFLAPTGLIRRDELPPRFGLLEWDGRKIKEASRPELQPEHDSGQEVSILLSAMRRLGPLSPRGVSVKFYTIESKNRATIGIQNEDS